MELSRIEEWDSRPVPGGYAGLNDLADSEFTGVVSAGGTRLVMLNGRVVGVFDGAISDFEGGEATAYEAPDPSLPLLFAMQERGGEVRGQYYTDDTPISEVDETLTSGGFTGYLELSENVLSGDYYVVYYGGRSLSVAFVGNESRVVTGSEAMELAVDEVGIYEVRAVDLEVTDVPEPPEDATSGAAATDEPGEEVPDSEEDSSGAEAAAATAAATGGEGGDEPDAGDPVEPEDGSEDGSGDRAEAANARDVSGEDEGGAEPDDVEPDPPIAEAEPADEPGDDATDERPAPSGEPSAGSGGARSAGDGGSSGPRAEPGAGGPPAGGEPAEASEPDERFEEEAKWREARTVPALDPEESERPAADRPPEPSGGAPVETPREPSTPDAEVEAVNERLRRLEAELESSERERRRLTERLEEAIDERDEVSEEREALESRIEELEARLQEAEAAAASGATDDSVSPSPRDGAPAGRSVDPETALNQTDLFVRYGSKGKATLKTAHEGRAGFEEVDENLRIETHSRFDTDTATVEGRPFDDYLEGTIQYRFVSWLVEELLYEIQETGSEAGLRALYDVLPDVDRAEFNGEVTGRDEAGEEQRQSFDVVCRDRMGKPLIVANINDSLDPATGDMMVRLVEDGTAAAEAHDSIGAAFFVTASFFEPDALETVADATRGGGILSRGSKKSFVKLARNGGYHLSLVEARGDDFHVAVPEF